MDDRPAKKKIESFEDLFVFQEARKLAKDIHGAAEKSPLARDRILVDQMCRAVLSIVSNIAEGYERGTNADFARSLYIARGSAGELRAQLLVALDRGRISGTEHKDFSERCRRISVGLNNLARYLKETTSRRG